MLGSICSDIYNVNRNITKIINGGKIIWQKAEQDPCQNTCQNCQTRCEKNIEGGCQTACESTNQCGRTQACINCQGRCEKSESSTS